MTQPGPEREDTHAQRFPPADRLRKRREFLQIQREGRRVHTPHFIVVVGPGTEQRIGVTVTKKVANAVGRNRVKRLVRELFRRNRALFPPQTDVVLVARPGAQALDYARLVAEVEGARAALRDAARRGRDLKPRGRLSRRKETTS